MCRFFFAAILSLGLLCGASAAVTEDFHHAQDEMESTLLDLYEGTASPHAADDLNQAWQAMAAHLTDPAARTVAAFRFSQDDLQDDLPASIGTARSLLDHIAALQALADQRAGRVEEARIWRDFITLPKFANADDGGLLLQLPADQVRQANVTQALAKEYLGWQVARIRQLFDGLQRTLTTSEVSAPFVRENLAEIAALAHFPQPLFQAAGVPVVAAPASIPALVPPFNSAAAQASLAAWREGVETGLPNLLTAADVSRLERLLARLVELVPKEYRNGVEGGHILIPLEHQEAVQFTQQAQGLVGELTPTWRRDQREAYDRYHGPLNDALARLQQQIDRVEDVSKVEASARDISAILEDRFHLSARQAGNKGQVVEEAALEARSSLSASLAAARAGHWQEAESLRLDAYTSFDSEIEIRVLPRNPELANRAERSFIDGQGSEPGIKALLDRHAPMDELAQGYARALKNMESCAAILKVSVSPQTIGFTAFTIIGREGLEAIVILAALLAGLKGEGQEETRRWVVAGATGGVLLSLLTFALSQTVVKSLMHYGEKLEAVVSVLALIVLLMVTNWVFHKVYWVGWNTRLRTLSKKAQQVQAPRWEFMALLGVGFLTVYREGFETTVFMQSLLLEGGGKAVSLGVLAGFAFVGSIGALIFFFGVKLPYRKLLVVTGLLVVSIMVTFLGSTVRLFQTVGWLNVHPIPHLSFPNWIGLWLGLYPSWEGLLIPPLALVYVGGAWLFTRWQSAQRAKREAAEEKAESVSPQISTAVPFDPAPVVSDRKARSSLQAT